MVGGPKLIHPLIPKNYFINCYNFHIYPQKLSKPLFAVYSRAPKENPFLQGVFSPQGISITLQFKDCRILALYTTTGLGPPTIPK